MPLLAAPDNGEIQVQQPGSHCSTHVFFFFNADWSGWKKKKKWETWQNYLSSYILLLVPLNVTRASHGNLTSFPAFSEFFNLIKERYAN